MNIYADTSALIAWFHPADPFAARMMAWCRDKEPEFCWNVFLRAELRHNQRRIAGNYAPIAWHAYRASEGSKRLRLNLHPATELLAWGDELSARHGSSVPTGTLDFLHVAAAQRLGADIFATCDVTQGQLARLAGLKEVQLFR